MFLWLKISLNFSLLLVPTHTQTLGGYHEGALLAHVTLFCPTLVVTFCLWELFWTLSLFSITLTNFSITLTICQRNIVVVTRLHHQQCGLIKAIVTRLHHQQCGLIKAMSLSDSLAFITLHPTVHVPETIKEAVTHIITRELVVPMFPLQRAETLCMTRIKLSKSQTNTTFFLQTQGKTIKSSQYYSVRYTIAEGSSWPHCLQDLTLRNWTLSSVEQVPMTSQPAFLHHCTCVSNTSFNNNNNNNDNNNNNKSNLHSATQH